MTVTVARVSWGATAAPWVGAGVSAASIAYLAFTRWRDAHADRAAQARLIRIVPEVTASAAGTGFRGHLHNASERPIFDAVLSLHFKGSSDAAAVSMTEADLPANERGEELTFSRTQPGDGLWRAEFTDATGLKWTIADGQEPELVWKRRRS